MVSRGWVLLLGLGLALPLTGCPGEPQPSRVTPPGPPAAEQPAEELGGRLTWHQEVGYRWAAVRERAGMPVGFTRLSRTETGLAFRNHLSFEGLLKSRSKAILLNGSGVAPSPIIRRWSADRA